MTRLTEGQAAPDFSIIDMEGKTHKPGDYRGQYLLLSFYRYASCPFCNLRISQMIQRTDAFKTQGLEIL